jgi:hypothetical protein
LITLYNNILNGDKNNFHVYSPPGSQSWVGG